MSIRDGDDTNGPLLVGALLFTHHRRVGDLQDLLTFSHLDHLETNISQAWTPFFLYYQLFCETCDTLFFTILLKVIFLSFSFLRTHFSNWREERKRDTWTQQLVIIHSSKEDMELLMKIDHILLIKQVPTKIRESVSYRPNSLTTWLLN